MRRRLGLVTLGALALLALGGCAQPPQQTTAAGQPTRFPPRSTVTPALPTGTPIPTAPIFVNQDRQPVWPTPPVWCRTSPVGNLRPELAPTIGEFPVWLAARPLPVLPWRNDLVRTIWVVDRSVSGDLILGGRQTDGPGFPQFVREGSEGATTRLVIGSAPRIGSTTSSPAAAKYADIQVYLSAPQPGCYEINARLGEYTQTYTIYLYN